MGTELGGEDSPFQFPWGTIGWGFVGLSAGFLQSTRPRAWHRAGSQLGGLGEPLGRGCCGQERRSGRAAGGQEGG